MCMGYTKSIFTVVIILLFLASGKGADRVHIFGVIKEMRPTSIIIETRKGERLVVDITDALQRHMVAPLPPPGDQFSNAHVTADAPPIDGRIVAFAVTRAKQPIAWPPDRE